MSLYGALLSGVSGLRAQSQSLGTVSDNISNVNTIAYKRSAAQFSTLVTGASSTSTYFPGGVRASPRALVDQQGVLQTSTRATDVAILGNGFFVVKSADNSSGELLYTRSGSFAEDNQGRLANAAGYFLQGWPLDQQGNIIDVNTIQTVSVSTQNGVAVDTTNIEIGANLNSDQSDVVPGWNLATFMTDPTGGGNQASEDLADGTVTPHFRRALKVFDALGTSHNINISFVKLAGVPNQWGFSISAETPAEITGAIGNGGLLSFGSLTFNGDGSLNAVDFRTAGSLAADLNTQSTPIAWANGAAASALVFDFGTEGAIGIGRTDGLTQFAAANNVGFVNQDGAEVGLRTGVSIDTEGFVVASFSNGATQRIWKLPVSTFANPSRLEARNGNAYAQTDASGEFNLREANTGGAGRIEPGALEGSNVDLSEEFTAMIVTQRAYSASAKTITTADEMLDELLRIKR